MGDGYVGWMSSVVPTVAVEVVEHVGWIRFDRLPVNAFEWSMVREVRAAIDEMVADVEAATDHVHLMFYIWLTDNNDMKMVEALKRAAARGEPAVRWWMISARAIWSAANTGKI